MLRKSAKNVRARTCPQFVSVSAVSALLALPAAAQQTPPLAPTRLPEVVVTSARIPDQTVSLENFPGNVTVVTAKEIAASPAFTLPELLRQQAGFTLLDSAGFGAHLAPFSLRGYGEKSGTLVLVDGVRMNDGGTGFFLWNSVPLQNIERVEIIRGGASTIYGEGGAGGVINIITKDAAAKPLAGSAGAEVGNLGFYSGHVEFSGRTNIVGYSVSAERKEWSGWREHSNFRDWNAQAKISADTAVGKFTLGYTYHTEHSEDAGQLTSAQYQANPRQAGAFRFVYEDTVHRGSLDYAKEFSSGWTASAKMHGQTYDSAFPLFAGTGRETTFGGVWQVRQQAEYFNRDNTFTLGGEAMQDDFSQQFGGPPTIDNSTVWSGFVQDAFKVTKTTTLTGGLRFDRRSSFLNVPFAFPAFTGTKENNVWSPSVSLSQELAEKTSAWLSYSQTHRLASANDIVSADPRFASNPSLVPLNAKTWEIGLRAERSPLLAATIAAFHSQVDNDIFSDAFGSPANGNAIRRGVEVALKSKPADWLELHGTATYTDAHFDGGPNDGRRQVLVPEWQLTAGVSIHPAKGWTWTIEDQFVTGQVRILDLANQLPRNEFNVINTRLSYTWRQLTTYVAVNNLLDRRYEQFPSANPFAGPIVPAHSPAAGINFRAGINVTF